MRLARIIVGIAACASFAACSSEAAKVAGPVVPVHSISPLAPPAEATALLQPDAGAALAALGFPAGWPLPVDGSAAVVGVLVRHSKGDSVHHTYRTAYRVAAARTEAVAGDWASSFRSALHTAKLSRLGTITGGGAVKVLWSSGADAAPLAPKLTVSAAQAQGDASAPVTVVAEFETVDSAMPSIAAPTQTAVPSFGHCDLSRFDIDYHAFDDPTSPNQSPTYTLWREATCPTRDVFDAAVTWANAHGNDLSANTTGFSQKVDLGGGATADVSANLAKSGAVFLMVVVQTPIPLAK